MPIEIKELHIKATVVDKKETKETSSLDRWKDMEKMKKQLVKDCVYEVLQILEEKRER